MPKLTAAPRGMQFCPWGLSLVEPSAFGELFFCRDEERTNVEMGSAVIVEVSGPLEQRPHWIFDSYDEIKERVRAACMSPTAKAVVMKFNSPGGVAGGTFETAREIREICDAANKQLHAYVEGSCNSAAYALACVCDSITIGESGLCGSVGVLMSRKDMTAMRAQMGLRVALITSGERKADGHPDQPISEAELQNAQTLVDSLASVFFNHVAEHRAASGISAESVQATQAKVMHGAAAVMAGLADEVGPMSAVLARIEGGGGGITAMAGTAYEKARAALEEAAKGTDANAKAARGALAALDAAGGGDNGGEKKDDDKKEDPPAGDPPAKTEGDKPAGDPPKKEEEQAAATAESAMKIALASQRETAQLRAELKARDEADERRTLLASKPLTIEMRAVLEEAPIALVRKTIAGIEGDPAQPTNPELERTPTRGDSQDGGGARLPPKMKNELDIRMGLAERDVTAESSPYRLVLGPKPSKPAGAGKTN